MTAEAKASKKDNFTSDIHKYLQGSKLIEGRVKIATSGSSQRKKQGEDLISSACTSERRDPSGTKEEEKRILEIQLIRWWVCVYIEAKQRSDKGKK